MTDQQPAAWVPEFPGQRPPFQPGNALAFKPGHERSVQHGAYSPRKVDPLAETLVQTVLDDGTLADLHAPRWRMALWAWARAEAQAQLLTEYVAKAAEETADGVGDLDADRVRSAYLLLHRAEARANTLRGRLGLDPLSAARLGRDRAAAQHDVAKAMAQLERQERERQEGGRDD